MRTNMESMISKKYEILSGRMDEQIRRLWAAAESKVLGHGGQTIVERATGIARRTMSQLRNGRYQDSSRE
jgi:hypothetical protein